MHRVVCSLAVVLLAMTAFGQSARNAPQTAPHWIWHRDWRGDSDPTPGSSQGWQFERSVAADQPVRAALLRVAADFCEVRIEINDQPVIVLEPYGPTSDVDVTSALRRGANRIVAKAKSVGGPAAIAISLSLVLADGSRRDVVSNSDWTVSQGTDKRPAVSLGVVAAELWGIGRRPGTIDPFDNYEQWRQAVGTPAAADKAAFWTAPGFEISLIRQALPEEGSWVSMTFDPQGRITIAREDKGLLRMDFDGQRRSIRRVETINDELQECRGLLYAYGALYANANNSKGLYRLRDTDGDDQFDEVRLLREFPGSVGHGRNDLALGPDGLIYSIHGDAVDVPKEAIFDYTSPFREARRGKNTKEGYLVRTDREGQQWELIAAGLRNPFGIAFNQRGDLFTYDADAEFDMGSPWYRPTRVDQLVSGADFGWRGVTGKWPPYFPDHADNALPTLDIGRGSPTAVAFGTQANFPPDYRRALFILDWTYGRILAVHLAPRGTGYRGWAETFLQGRPLNVTDLAIGPDGALYLITGGRKTQSALYRVASSEVASPEQPRSAHEDACFTHAEETRQLRLKLEGCHRELGGDALEIVWPHLASPDPLIAHAARIAVEHQPLSLWRQRALKEQSPDAALTALLALARSGDKTSVPAIVDRLVQLSPGELSVSQTLLLLQTYFLCWEQLPEVAASRRAAILAQLEPLFPHPSARWAHVSRAGMGSYLNRELARLLVTLDSPVIVEKVARSLLSSDVQEDRLQGLFVLRSAKQRWTDDWRRQYFTALNDASSFVGGEGMPKFLSQIRDQALATLTDREREALADLLVRQPLDNEPPPPQQRPLIRHWTLAELEPLLGGSGDAGRGAAVFRDALCARCHRAGARGPAVGPDLTHVAGRFSRRDILESILSPSKVVAENYRNVQISITDGRQIVGRVVMEGDFRSEKLRIATEPLRPSAIVELSKREIDQVREAETSPMPQGLLDSFKWQEILDLLAFLQSGAKGSGAVP